MRNGPPIYSLLGIAATFFLLFVLLQNAKSRDGDHQWRHLEPVSQSKSATQKPVLDGAVPNRVSASAGKQTLNHLSAPEVPANFREQRYRTPSMNAGPSVAARATNRDIRVPTLDTLYPPEFKSRPSALSASRELQRATDASAKYNGVRQINWEQVKWEHIEPASERSFVQGTPAYSVELVRQKRRPEIEHRAVALIEYGKSMATRGAYFSAREEFLKALALIAESNDRLAGGNAYSVSLATGLTALKESKDFGRVSPSQDARLVVASHTSKVIDFNQVNHVSFGQASEAYCRFGQVRIEQAIGDSPAGSAALYNMARLYDATRELQAESGSSGLQQRAMLLASLKANASNSHSANDLGVLLFRAGQYKPSIRWFLHALQASGGNKLYWTNLAEAHQQVVNTTDQPQERREHQRLAQVTLAKAQSAPAPSDNSASNIVGWVSTEQFQLNSPPSETSFQRTVEPSKRRPLLHTIKEWF